MTQQNHFWTYAQNNSKQGLSYFYTNVHSSIIHNSPKVETKMSISQWMDK